MQRAGATDGVAWLPLPAAASRPSPCLAGSLGLTVLPMFEKAPDSRGARTPGSQGGVAGGAVPTRHPVAAEFPAWVRRRRPRLRARCEGGADGEEEGGGRGSRCCQIFGLRRNHHHGDRGRRKGPSPTLFQDLGMSFSASQGEFPCELQVPAAAGPHRLLRKGRVLRGPLGVVVLRPWAEDTLRPLVNTATTFAPSEAPLYPMSSPTFAPSHHLLPLAPNSLRSSHTDLLAVLPTFTTEAPLFSHPPRTRYGRRGCWQSFIHSINIEFLLYVRHCHTTGDTAVSVTLGIADHQRRILTQPGKIRESWKFENLSRESSIKG